MNSLRWRSLFIGALTLAAIYAISPTLIYFSTPKDLRNDEEIFLKRLPSWLPQSHVKLGLDLQGGVQLVLGVDTSDAIENRLNRSSVELKRWAAKNDFKVATTYVPKGETRLVVVLEEQEQLDSFRPAFKKEYPHLVVDSREQLTLRYRYKDSELDRIKKSALENAEQVVRKRIDTWGVSEPMINRRGDGSILVQLPGFRDPQKAKSLLGRTAQLKFKIVDSEFSGFAKIDLRRLPEGITVSSDESVPTFSSEDRQALEALLAPHVPPDRELLVSRTVLGDGSDGRYRYSSYVVFAEIKLTGDDIQDALATVSGEDGFSPVVSMRMTPSGARQFGKVTGANINKRLAIILDDIVESAPVINQRISGGQAQITLGGSRPVQETMEEANQLALVLKSGAIPAKISVLEERQVGASLGPELANQGIKGILVGLMLVLVFMVLYYRRPGLLACAALLLNAIFLLAIMAGFGFALSLPGIAGFVLTLGMAVDANVLINERIRQEIREGRHPRKAIGSGFQKVFWTIIDANVTTLIAALVLLETNPSGPIRGFAITLMIGLLVSLFTSLYCTRLFFELATGLVADKRLKGWLGGQKPRERRTIDFLRHGPLATALSALLALGVVGTGAVRGMNFGVDFSGGTELLVHFEREVEPEQIIEVGEQAQVAGLTLQALEGGKQQWLLRYDESSEDAEGVKATASETYLAFKKMLDEQLQEFKPQVMQVDFVGPQVGRELRLQGALSVLYAILAVILYIGLRFDMRFGPGALCKMFLDILVMLGFYVFFWASFDLVAVAAFLTVVGYSVNDTIVIYDRIRENLKAHPRRALRENINLAINETLGRSINTALTTAISLTGILVFATGQIWTFAMAMTIGVVVATLSSIFVASIFVVWFEQYRGLRAQRLAAASR